MSLRLAQSVQVIDSHTAGHPTRTILGGLPPLAGETVRERRDHFERNFDHLRPALLHEPRGHAAMVAAIVTESRDADIGAFFVSSYIYLDMCGHGTIGLAKTLVATGQIDAERHPRFTLETPAGVVTVDLRMSDGELDAVSLLNVPAYVEHPCVTIEMAGGQRIELAIAYGGCRYALVDAEWLGQNLDVDRTGTLCALGAAIKTAIREQSGQEIDSVLFYQDLEPGRSRHLVVLEDNKFDRSPCGTGSSARLAQLVAEGRLGEGESWIAEGVLGTSFHLEAAAVATEHGRQTVTARITGQAYITAFSTLVIEAGDPLAAGFLCR
ncbi:MAG: proline racemase family protein [Alphaproteobacteria bacterium]|nr:proline racemase family protein [Alphaproteobacteria bacterium]